MQSLPLSLLNRFSQRVSSRPEADIRQHLHSATLFTHRVCHLGGAPRASGIESATKEYVRDCDMRDWYESFPVAHWVLIEFATAEMMSEYRGDRERSPHAKNNDCEYLGCDRSAPPPTFASRGASQEGEHGNCRGHPENQPCHEAIGIAHRACSNEQRKHGMRRVPKHQRRNCDKHR